MKLFLFASGSLTNIRAGIGANLRAVNKTSDAGMKARITQSAQMKIGSLGLLYCNEYHSFTTPFAGYSAPDVQRVETDVCRGEWYLPIRIHPLGSPRRQVHKDVAVANWTGPKEARANATASMNLTGTTVLAPRETSTDDWALMLDAMAE